MERKPKPYPWYRPFRRRLRNAWHMDGHRSKAHTGDPKKKKPAWPRWRQEVAHFFVVLCTFLSQPEYWLNGHYNLTYSQCGWIRRRMYWESRLYRWATGFGIEEDN